jgi:hypothetical protein
MLRGPEHEITGNPRNGASTKVVLKSSQAGSKGFIRNQAQAGKHLFPVRFDVRQHHGKLDHSPVKLREACLD